MLPGLGMASAKFIQTLRPLGIKAREHSNLTTECSFQYLDKVAVTVTVTVLNASTQCRLATYSIDILD